jgi:hypothetical protein
MHMPMTTGFPLVVDCAEKERIGKPSANTARVLVRATRILIASPSKYEVQASPCITLKSSHRPYVADNPWFSRGRCVSRLCAAVTTLVATSAEFVAVQTGKTLLSGLVFCCRASPWIWRWLGESLHLEFKQLTTLEVDQKSDKRTSLAGICAGVGWRHYVPIVPTATL